MGESARRFHTPPSSLLPFPFSPFGTAPAARPEVGGKKRRMSRALFFFFLFSCSSFFSPFLRFVSHGSTGAILISCRQFRFPRPTRFFSFFSFPFFPSPSLFFLRADDWSKKKEKKRREKTTSSPFLFPSPLSAAKKNCGRGGTVRED